MKNEGVRAVHAHFEGVAAQSNAEFGIRNSEFRTEAMECVLGSTAFTESKSAVYGGAASAPSEGFGFRAPPVADTARKASRCRPQVRERIAEARAENGEGAKLSRPKDTKARLRER